MKKNFFCCFFGFFPIQLVAQTYIIPWAQQQPSWVFPLWFENGNGEKDTIYFCVDSNALAAGCSEPLDTIFGERIMYFDSEHFNVFFDCTENQCDYHTRAIVHPYLEYNGSFLQGINIYACHAQLPLTVRWDRNMFYSDSIPLPDNDPAPRAEGLLWSDLSMTDSGCGADVPLLMTDTITNENVGCYRTDSIVFNGTYPSNLTFIIRSWTGDWVGIEYNLAGNDIVIFPNPVGNLFRIKGAETIKGFFEIIIYDVLGEQKLILGNATNEIDATSLKSGLHFLRIVDSSGSSAGKLFMKT